MGVPYGCKPQGGLVVNGGESKCFGIDWASRGWISKVVVIQTDGQRGDFTVELFNSENGCKDVSASDSVGVETGPLPADLYSISPVLHGIDGKLKYFSEESTGGAGFVMCSQDNVRQNRARKVWVRITPTGIGAKEFAVALDGESLE